MKRRFSILTGVIHSVFVCLLASFGGNIIASSPMNQDTTELFSMSAKNELVPQTGRFSAEQGMRNTTQPRAKVVDHEILLDQLFSIDMVDADLREVLRLIGEQAGLNILASPDVEGIVTANLDNVSVGTALEAILKANGFSYFLLENIIIVKVAETEMFGELETMVIKLNYINSEDLRVPLGTVLSPRGSLESFSRVISRGGEGKAGLPNIVLISDVRENIPRIRKVIQELDVPVPQVNIAVKFIETTLDTSEELGINWSPSPLTMGAPDTLLGIRGIPLKLNSLTIATLNPLQFNSALKLLMGKGRSKLLSSPQITTLDNQQAEIEVVTTVLIERLQFGTGATGIGGGAGGTQGGVGGQGGFGALPISGLEEKDIGIKLTVTPRVNEGGLITLVVQTTVEALLSTAETETDRPRTSKRTAETQITVLDGETVIIGGLITENLVESSTRVPFLGSIPILGALFRSKKTTTEQRELLIFITPNIVG